jgi:L-ascorbate metabolism protein UlaG (beta-lactamase superfamily)
MDITWQGETCFMVKDREKSVIVNPSKDKLKADIVLTSLGDNTAEVKESLKTFDWPGEYEIRQVPINAYQAWTEPKAKKEKKETKAENSDEENTEEAAGEEESSEEKPKKAVHEPIGSGEETLIFCFAVNRVRFCHLGELGHTLTSEMVKKIGDVDVLMIKIGEGSNLDSKKAMDIIEEIEPRIVIPMGSAETAASLKTLGIDEAETAEKFSIKKRSELPEEQMKYLVLAAG